MHKVNLDQTADKALKIVICLNLFFAIATVGSIGWGLYCWIGLDMIFKLALWEGLRYWLISLAIFLGGTIATLRHLYKSVKRNRI